MSDEHENASPPSRRTVAKGAAWTVPALSVAAVVPRVAASPAQCTAASQQTINNAMTLARTRTHPLELNFWQLAGVLNNGVARNIWVNLRNPGPGVIRATPADPVIVEVDFQRVPGSFTGNRTRTLNTVAALPMNTAWGAVTRSGTEVGAEGVRHTWRITRDIVVRTSPTTEADLRLVVGTRTNLVVRDPLIYATARITSFGPNDDLTASDFPTIAELGLGSQAGPCTTYYDAQVIQNSGADQAIYTLQAAGALQPNGTEWPVGSVADTRTLGNGVGLAIDFGSGVDYDGIW